MCRKALSLSLGALTFFGIGLVTAQAGLGAGGGSTRPVLLSEIQSQATISVAQGVTLDFSDGGSNNVTVQSSDNPAAVHITSKTNAATVAPGTAHLRVVNFGQCPTSKEMPAATPAPPGAIPLRPAENLMRSYSYLFRYDKRAASAIGQSARQKRRRSYPTPHSGALRPSSGLDRSLRCQTNHTLLVAPPPQLGAEQYYP